MDGDHDRAGRAARREAGEGAAGACPVCGAPGAAKVRPFCSRACADIDLLRWLRGGYVIAGKMVEEDEDGEAQTALARPAGAPDDPAH